ncbi:GTP binding protein HflX [Cyanidioschyzon merolae strain 10D]|jgi:GTP-binding protein HflX|uniref:GTP binding protein HflX n=1 Tax=Cyanidioschyzon merolae (strain NIES-3377 / 10D) TaxID=280699 RepID=M1VMM0_CYAM1|nr:GTP binding protein HflX [Cyanidioschyzon merolae strain 10D]BAM83323.1 GTP binding protein HflX [Cyanidioschyzon merolae strain 10D]|eukprot:XP_005539359.1 GTP binding protein HflX [Cyanidioschyzon merolae strain 10D]
MFIGTWLWRGGVTGTSYRCSLEPRGHCYAWAPRLPGPRQRAASLAPAIWCCQQNEEQYAERRMEPAWRARLRYVPPTRCFLVGAELKSARLGGAASTRITLEQSLDELAELCSTAGMEVMGRTVQKLTEFQSRTLIGSGKVLQVRAMMQSVGATACVFDEQLSPSQQRALEEAFGGERSGIQVLDRTAVILDIFAQHAMSREGALQIELALLQYRLPRLTRMWQHLERQSGGLGVAFRGPGETQIEVDRRIIAQRIARLRRELEGIRQQRQQRRRQRAAQHLPSLVLTGYTSSGKSTLLNALTHARVFADPMLFCTLDPTTRRAEIPGLNVAPEVLITDSVGFIQKLPTELIAAFRATLEVVVDADIILHVIDRSSPSWRAQAAVVEDTLSELGVLRSKPRIVIWNKMDLIEHATSVRHQAAILSRQDPPVVPLSALTGEGLDDLMECISDTLRDMYIPVECLIPYTEAALASEALSHGLCDHQDYTPHGIYLSIRVPRRLANQLQKYKIPDAFERSVSTGADTDFVRYRGKLRGAGGILCPGDSETEGHHGDLAERSREGPYDDSDWRRLARGRHRL